MKLRVVRHLRPVGALVGALLAVCSVPAAAGELRVGGTGAVTELYRQLAPAFAAETGITLRIVPGLGSSSGNQAVADGVLGLSVSGRALRDAETAKGLKVVALFRTPFGMATSRPGPDNLKRSEIADHYGADEPAWPDGMPVLITLRPADESDYLVMIDYFPGMAEALVRMRKRRDLAMAATDQDNADATERNKGSFSAMTLVQIQSEKRNLRMVAIDGVAATLENYRSGAYPYSKSLYVVTRSTATPEAQAFIAFLGRPAATAILEKAAIIADAK